MSLTDQYVVLDREGWRALLDALAAGDVSGAVVAACAAPLDGEALVIRETDVLASQALYGYAGSIRTAVEFTELHGLSVMTDDIKDALVETANELTHLGCDWDERRTPGTSATMPIVQWGTLES